MKITYGYQNDDTILAVVTPENSDSSISTYGYISTYRKEGESTPDFIQRAKRDTETFASLKAEVEESLNG
jgi:hypothetical protein